MHAFQLLHVPLIFGIRPQDAIMLNHVVPLSTQGQVWYRK